MMRIAATLDRRKGPLGGTKAAPKLRTGGGMMFGSHLPPPLSRVYDIGSASLRGKIAIIKAPCKRGKYSLYDGAGGTFYASLK